VKAVKVAAWGTIKGRKKTIRMMVAVEGCDPVTLEGEVGLMFNRGLEEMLQAARYQLQSQARSVLDEKLIVGDS
jgi:hypothetical protein